MSPREISLAIEALSAETLAQITQELCAETRTVTNVALHYHLPLAVATEIGRRLAVNGQVNRPPAVAAKPAPVAKSAPVARVPESTCGNIVKPAAPVVPPVVPPPTAPTLKDPACTLPANWLQALGALSDAELTKLAAAIQPEQRRRQALARRRPALEARKQLLADKIAALQAQIKEVNASIQGEGQGELAPVAMQVCPECGQQFIGGRGVHLHRVRKHGLRRTA